MNKLWSFDTFVGTERFHTVLRYLEFPIDAFEIFVSGWDYFPSHMNDVVAKMHIVTGKQIGRAHV